MTKRFGSLVLTSVVLSACADPTTPAPPARLAPIADVHAGVQTQMVPNEYIVVLRGAPVGVAQLRSQAQGIAAAAGAQLLETFGAALHGFAVRASDAALTALRSHPSVEYVEPVQIFTKIATQSPTPSWGLDRIDQNNLPLDNSFTYPTGGSAVHIYIIDTGILLTHNEFSGRMGNGYDAVTTGGTANDCDGHGTHVAGTAAGTTYGIMKTATLHPVRVLNCSGTGTTTQVISGINWVTSNAVAPAVSNMSLGGSASTSLDNATNNMVAAGIVSAVAAGNSNADACNASPARAASALTVGSTTSSDARSSFSNWGTCLDIFAPGSSIFSAYIGSNSATATLSGTSMASPHVAGAAALYRSFNPSHTTTQVENALVSNATLNLVTNPGSGSPNRLLYMGFISGGPPNQLPTANFTYSCGPGPWIEYRCTFDGTSSVDPDGTIASWLWTIPDHGVHTGSTTLYGLEAGTYDVTLTVTDNRGGTNTKTMQVSVPGTQPPPPPPPPPTNQAPVANFTHTCVPGPWIEYRCDFDGSSSSDPDGTVVSWAWSIPGEGPRTGVTARWGLAAGTYAVTLTVTDDGGATNTKTVNIVVP